MSLVSGGGKKPATLPGSKEVESLADDKGLNPEVLMEWCRNLSGKAKFGEWNRKFPKESKGWKDRIEQNRNFIENTRELANFSSPSLPDGWKVSGHSFPDKKAEFLSPKPSFFIPSPDRFGATVLPARFPEIFARPFTL